VLGFTVQGASFWRVMLMLAILPLTACHRVEVGAVSSNAWGSPHELRIGRIQNPTSLNPLFATDQGSIDIGQLYTETLVGLNDRNQLIPIVAQRIPSRANGGITPDGLTITYRLRHGERFADGVPLTSRDVAFTYRAIMDARNPVVATTPYQEIASIETPDPYTVRVRLRRPWAAAVAELFAATDYAFGILPAHAFGNDTNIAHAAWNSAPFGSGPFRVVAWRRDDEIVFEPNPYALRKPHLHRLILKIIPDYSSMLVALQTHTIDVYGGVDETQLGAIRSLPGVRIVLTPVNYVEFLEFQTQRPPTDDPRVRKAIMEAIDRAALEKNVYMSLRTPANTEVASVLWAHDPAIQSLPFNPRQAASDLDHAGWILRDATRFKDSRPLELVLAFNAADSQQRRLATEVQAFLRVVGVQADLKGYPLSVMFAPANAGGVLSQGLFNIDAGSWFGGADPEASEFLTCNRRAPNGQNYSRFCNAAYDREYSLQQAEFDQRARTQAFFAMQQLVHDGYAYDFLNYATLFSAINPALQNWRPNMVYQCWNSYEWDIP
jgi:peptide/nickel transport system substrate-binding protein